MKLRLVTLASAIFIATYSPSLLAEVALPQELTAEQQAQMTKLNAILKDQHPQSGNVSLAAAKATLRLGDKYYFLDAEESRKVLVDGWGNPPSAADGVLGMVFPAGKTFLDDTWGAVLSYEQSGYVNDEDAKSTDYDELLTTLQSGEAETNEARKSGGYEPLHLVGWAQQPNYNPKNHSVIWAQNIKFGTQSDNSLNYDVRLLGRHGVLSLNLLSSMSKLPEITEAARVFGESASFNEGARYADFNKDTDKIAEYGVGGLVAAGLGIAAAKKLGFLAIALGLGKKLFVFIAIGFFALRNKVMALFRRNKDTLEG
ncbi:MAG: DUF2167 domain-containing protein [Pseudomonadota bacterium]